MHTLLPAPHLEKQERALSSVLVLGVPTCGPELLKKMLLPLGLGCRQFDSAEEAHQAGLAEVRLVVAGPEHFGDSAPLPGIPTLFLIDLPAPNIPENQKLRYPFTSEELWAKAKGLIAARAPTPVDGSFSSSLVALSGRILEARELSQVLLAAKEAVVEKLGYGVVGLFLREDGADSMVLWEYRGEDRLVPQTVPVKGDPVLEEVFSLHRPVVVEDARTDPRTNKEIVELTDCRSVVLIPFHLTDGRTGLSGRFHLWRRPAAPEPRRGRVPLGPDRPDRRRPGARHHARESALGQKKIPPRSAPGGGGAPGPGAGRRPSQRPNRDRRLHPSGPGLAGR